MAPDIHSKSIESRASGPEAAAILRVFHELAGRHRRVPVEALLAALHPEILQNIEILAPFEDDWRYLRFGAGLISANGKDMTGRRVGDLPSDISSAYLRMLSRVLDELQPVLVTSHELAPGEGGFWERLIMPCCDGDGEIRIVSHVRPHSTREDLIQAVFEASQDGMIAVRAVRDRDGRIVDGRIVTANCKACEYAGYSAESMLDASFKRLFPGLMARRIWRRCVRVIRERTTERFELNISHQQLDTWLRVTLVSLGDGFVISFSDVTDLKEALLAEQSSRAELAAEIEHRRALETELRQLSLTDDLTGVANRRSFARALRHEIGKVHRYGSVFSVIAIDIDHFKKINDCFGHAGGDEVLMAIAAIFTDSVRRNVDLVARVGGEEFMLLLPDTPLMGAVDLAERLRQHIETMPVTIAGQPVRITASFGVKQFNEKSDPERLTIEADDALYRAKRGGRNCVVACAAEPRV